MWLGIYFGLAAIGMGLDFLPAVINYHRLKKNGYKMNKGVFKRICEIHNNEPMVLSVMNLIIPPSYALISSTDKHWNLSKTKRKLLQENLILKTDELLKLESDLMIKEHKFNEAKKSLGEGKMGLYEEMNTIEKLEFINRKEEELSVENNLDDLSTAYDKLSRDEKKEFLYSLRRELIGEEDVNINLKGKVKKKKKD